jgi:hypothetical protein
MQASPWRVELTIAVGAAIHLQARQIQSGRKTWTALSPLSSHSTARPHAARPKPSRYIPSPGTLALELIMNSDDGGLISPGDKKDPAPGVLRDGLGGLLVDGQRRRMIATDGYTIAS